MKKKSISIIMSIISLVVFASCKSESTISSSMQENVASSDASSSGSANASKAQAGASSWALKFSTTTLAGDAITEKDFEQNKLTVLNIWATWCPPCIEELPYLQKLSEAYKEKGVQVAGVLQDGASQETGIADDAVIENALTLLKDASANYTVIIPEENIFDELISQMEYFPTTFFINSAGEVVHVAVGAKNFEEWSAEIDEVLEKI